MIEIFQLSAANCVTTSYIKVLSNVNPIKILNNFYTYFIMKIYLFTISTLLKCIIFKAFIKKKLDHNLDCMVIKMCFIALKPIKYFLLNFKK